MTQALDDYHRGEMDCINGQAHKGGDSADYDAGYAFQYELEQQQTAQSEREA